MPRVAVRNGNVEAAIRVFKRKVTDSGILMEHRERQFFEKISTRYNRNKRAAVIRERRRQGKDG